MTGSFCQSFPVAPGKCYPPIFPRLFLKRTPTPGVAIAVQTFGDFQNFNPLLHVISTDGCFSGHGTFHVGKVISPHDLEDELRHEVPKMLKAEGKIGDAAIENMLSWHHSGFNVYCGPAIWPHDRQLTTHITNRHEQTVRYYCYYSDKNRGFRKKAGEDESGRFTVEVKK